MTSYQYFGSFDQNYNDAHKRKDSIRIKEMIEKEIHMLALIAKSYLDENRRQEVSILMNKYSNTLTDLIVKDDLNSALENVDNFQNIFADITNKKLLKKLTTTKSREKCSAEHQFIEFQIKSNIGHVEKVC